MEIHPKFTNRQILAHYTSLDNRKEDISKVLHYLLAELNITREDADVEKMAKLEKKIHNLFTQYDMKWKQSNYTRDRFEKKNCSWLDSTFEIEHPLLMASASTVKPGPGRPQLPFEEKRTRAKQTKIARVSEELKHDARMLTSAASYAAKKTGKRDLAFMLTEMIRSPSRPSKVRRLIETNTSCEMMELEDALALILDLSLTKQQYVTIRLGAKNRNADIYPPYDKVREFKTTCRPSSSAIMLTNTYAKVDLQALLDLTAKRIVKLQEEIITHYSLTSKRSLLQATLICSWGFDGSTGQSQYKMKFTPDTATTSSSHQTDQSLFATTLIPLRLISTDGTILWANRAPQSVRHCRPIKLEYVKETTEHILEEKRAMDEEISQLKSILVESCETLVNIEYALNMTLIDGKVLNVITGTTSMQTCPICKATPSKFNDLSNIEREIFNPIPGSLKFGISPLHAWIRLFECCLHVSYRLPMKTWRIQEIHKRRMAARKALIQEELRARLGLIVDMPKPGGSGTTNDGNTARTAFKYKEVFAEVTGFDYELLERFHTILIALSCQLPLDPLLFGDYCRCTAELYVALYPWYPMPATLHKILVHGEEIILNSVLPVGMLGEEASEAQNKFFRRFRLSHARKDSRKNNLIDIFNRVLDASDPIISNISMEDRMRKRKRASIPEHVQNLLATLPEQHTPSDLQDEDEPDDSGLQQTIMNLETVELEPELD